MLENLRDINNYLIKKNLNNKEEYDKQMIIKKILKDDGCFSKINIEVAYSILRDLKVPEENIKRVYMNLI